MGIALLLFMQLDIANYMGRLAISQFQLPLCQHSQLDLEGVEHLVCLVLSMTLVMSYFLAFFFPSAYTIVLFWPWAVNSLL